MDKMYFIKERKKEGPLYLVKPSWCVEEETHSGSTEKRRSE